MNDPFGLVNDSFGLMSDSFGLASDSFGLMSGSFGLVNDSFGLRHYPRSLRDDPRGSPAGRRRLITGCVNSVHPEDAVAVDRDLLAQGHDGLVTGNVADSRGGV